MIDNKVLLLHGAKDLRLVSYSSSTFIFASDGCTETQVMDKRHNKKSSQIPSNIENKYGEQQQVHVFVVELECYSSSSQYFRYANCSDIID